METMAIDKQAVDVALTAKVASMSKQECIRRVFEIADSMERSPEALLETIKLLFGPNALMA
jgi:hypothetical protein